MRILILFGYCINIFEKLVFINMYLFNLYRVYYWRILEFYEVLKVYLGSFI